ncbi:MAG: hypothetical protein LBM68_00280, partial [Bacteroidales bacterium]|nr:hypothetical protein [Bacteroidales bacterium]
MKSIVRSMCTIGAILLFSTGLFAQANLLISGGNSVASYVCGNAQVAVWGNNSNNQLGLKGVTTAAIVSEPMMIGIDKFDNLPVSQVNSGSGAHFVALTCSTPSVSGGKTRVYAWGQNKFGQASGDGTIPGTDGAVVELPVRVRAGAEIDAAYKETVNGVSYLIGAKVVYSGNNCSFAILDNGDLVSWGGNAETSTYTDNRGQLGHGNTTTNTADARYVKMNASTRLQNVKEIYAGDNAAYALTESGQVYSWGGAINGGLGLPNVTVPQPYARAVYYGTEDGGTGGLMNNIISIACSDGAAFAIDANNYIWAWGNGGWNSQLGVGNNIGGPTPRRVRNIGTTAVEADYLQAKQVGGGQGFGMAITMDDQPVAWGGGGCGDGGGGASIAGLTDNSNPRLITRPTSEKLDDGTYPPVVLINRGDLWGYYVNALGDVYAFGCGANGVLGTGNENNATTPVKITLPTGCGMTDLKPTVDISPKQYEVCASEFNGIDIISGYTLSKNPPSTKAPYAITWYKDDVEIKKTPTAPEKGVTTTWATWAQLKAAATLAAAETVTNGAGEYKVTVEYLGTNGGCAGIPTVADSMVITFFPQEFEDPGTLKVDCATKKAAVHVAPKSPATATTIAKRVYEWYQLEVGGSPLATTVGTGTDSLDVTALDDKTPLETPNQKIVWVEETAGAAGTFMKRTSQTCTTTSGDLNLSTGTISPTNNKSYAGFTVYETVTITEANILLQTSIYQTGNSGTANVTLGIWKAGSNNGGAVPAGATVGTLTATYTRTRSTEAQDLIVVVPAVGSVTLAPGEYFIGPSAYSGTGDIANPKLWGTSCAGIKNSVDDATGNILKQNLGIAAYNNPNQNSENPMAFDIKFQTSQRYCDRVPMYIVEDCPTCTRSKDIEITATSALGTVKPGDAVAKMDTVELCEGQDVVLTTNNINLGSYTNYSIRWYKAPIDKAAITTDVTSNTGLQTASPATTATPLTVTYTDATATGTKYYVLAFDNFDDARTCHVWDSVIVFSNPTPTATVTGGDIYCEGATVAPVVVEFSDGTAPYTFTATGDGV